LALPVSAREGPKVPMLPNRILIHAGENRYILAATALVDRTFEGKDVICTKLIVVKANLEGCWLKTDSEIQNPAWRYIERDSKRHKSKIYECDVQRTQSYIESNGRIYVYSFSPFIVLPSICYHIMNGKYLHLEWHVELGSTPPIRVDSTLPIKEIAKIPGHVLKGYIDGLIREKESCPVTLEEFRLGNITVTGCGHAFQKGSLDSVSACPLCRVNLVKEEFVFL
jgi:hypothetical protein